MEMLQVVAEEARDRATEASKAGGDRAQKYKHYRQESATDLDVFAEFKAQANFIPADALDDSPAVSAATAAATATPADRKPVDMSTGAKSSICLCVC